MNRYEVPEIVRVATKRLRRGSHVRLAVVHEPAHIKALLRPEPALLAALRSPAPADRAQVAVDLERHAAELAAQFCAWIWRNDQFVEIDGDTRARIESVYRASLRGALQLSDSPGSPATFADVQSLLMQHGDGLRSILLQLPLAARQRVSAEYSPGLQLRVLRLSPHQLAGPILDVGCGANARLVRHLKDRGIEAVGIDRRTPSEIEADWLEHAPGERQWQTILSHQAFSLHFDHHHRRGSRASAAEYARAYMRYLLALRVGGTMVYAPGLPFIEPALPPDRWTVSAFHGEIDGVCTSATHITRRY
jgi:hypothetical protein